MHGKISLPGCPAIKQYFSLPAPIIRYQAENPSSSAVYQKLTQSCKYFFERNPILIVPRIHNNARQFCLTDQRECYRNNDHKCCVKIDIKKITAKIWLTGALVFDSSDKNIPKTAALLLPKFYRCDSAILGFWDKNISIKNFKLLAPKFQRFLFFNAGVYQNGSQLMLETILEIIPQVSLIWYRFTHNFIATSSTLKNILKIKYLENLQYFYLCDVPDVFEIEDLTNLIKIYKDTKFRLDFCSSISEAYKNLLDLFIDTVVDSGVFMHVYYPGQDKEKLEIMKQRDIH